MSRFFIDRPIFACVISIIVMVMGIVAIRQLPVEQYPDIAPVSINVTANYTGASAQTVENSVTQLLEQQITGIDNILYFSSTSSASGQSRISISFAQGTNPDTAQVQVQNSVNRALNRLPDSVQQQGVTVTKSQGTDTLMVVGIYDTSRQMSNFDLSDYLINTIQEPVARINGVGETSVFGSAYAMRIWLNPQKLNQYGLIPSDIRAAVQAQNTQVTAGELGGAPSSDEQYFNAQVTALSQLQTVDEFNNIILKSTSAGGLVYLKDVARVELGAENYQNITRINGYPSSAMSVSLASGANALQVADAVRAKVAELQKNLPHGVQVAYPRDSTPFVKASIHGVVKTLLEAIVLVVVVMFLFLQSWRATLVPTIAVPVVLLGTFGVLAVLGFSINTLTMFALVLAIGLLVDDAIVVVENIERLMHEQHLSPKQATIESMQEIQGAVIGITMVLTAVFIPMAFFSGSTGVIYRQFAITIVTAMILSAMVALTITPAICAAILKPKVEKTTGFFARFNQGFDWLQRGYQRRLTAFTRLPVLAAIIFVALSALLAFLYMRLPTSFLPEEDQGSLTVQYQLPEGTPLSRTVALSEQISRYFSEKEKKNLNAIIMINGRSQAGTGQNVGQAFISLVDWTDRPGKDNSAAAIIARANKHFKHVKDARITVGAPAAIRGLGDSNGFEMWLRDSGGMGRQALTSTQKALVDTAGDDPSLSSVRMSSLNDKAQLHLNIDQKQASILGLSQSDINSTLAAAWGGTYINDFIDRGRIKRVYMQGDQQFRAKPENLADWYVRQKDGQMVSFATFSNLNWTSGPQVLQRFNGLSAVKIQGAAAQGVSSGDAMHTMQQLVDQHEGFDLAWSGVSFEENASSSQTTLLYAVSIGFVFLCLAALYESWSIPAAVMLVIPLGVVGTVLFTTLAGFTNDVYFQVALLTSIGLSSKNAILIVEFAASARARGAGILEAALEGARLRLRPILMTSIAFVAGVIPLALATGAGAVSRQEIGVSVIGGMLFGTALAVFFVPLFYVMVNKYVVRQPKELAPL